MNQPIVLSDFRSSVEHPRHRPDPYALNRLADDLNEFIRAAGTAGIGEEFIVRATLAVLDGFRRLDALPRWEPFWVGTNRRPTWYKLPEFCTKLLKDDPGDERAASTLAATSIIGYQNFHPAFWDRLLREHGLGPSWPIHAALYLTYCGPDSTDLLIPVLDRTTLRKAAVPILSNLAQSEHRSAGPWALRVLDALGVG